jgi:hypothetical protein
VPSDEGRFCRFGDDGPAQCPTTTTKAVLLGSCTFEAIVVDRRGDVTSSWSVDTSTFRLRPADRVSRTDPPGSTSSLAESSDALSVVP